MKTRTYSKKNSIRRIFLICNFTIILKRIWRKYLFFTYENIPCHIIIFTTLAFFPLLANYSLLNQSLFTILTENFCFSFLNHQKYSINCVKKKYAKNLPKMLKKNMFTCFGKLHYPPHYTATARFQFFYFFFPYTIHNKRYVATCMHSEWYSLLKFCLVKYKRNICRQMLCNLGEFN